MINKTLSAIMLCGILSGTVSASDPWGTSPRVLDEHTPSQSGSEHVKDSDMMAESARPQRAPEEELAPARRSPDFREAGIQDTMGLDATELLKQDLSETRAREREAQRQLSWMREELRKVLEELSGAKDAMEAQQCAHTGAMEEVRAQNQKLTSELIEARELNEELASAATDRDEVSRLRAQLAEFAAENERLRAELDEARAAGHGVAPAYGSGFAPEMEPLRAENAALRDRLAESDEEIASLRGRLAEFAAENERLRAERDGAGAAGLGRTAPAYGSGFAPEMELLRAENAELLAQVAKSAGRT